VYLLGEFFCRRFNALGKGYHLILSLPRLCNRYTVHLGNLMAWVCIHHGWQTLTVAW
jgi:hypothetical protein